jgi:hypothetical protein
MGTLPNLTKAERDEIARRYAAGERVKTIAFATGRGERVISTVAWNYGITRKSHVPLINRGCPGWAQGLLGFGS